MADDHRPKKRQKKDEGVRRFIEDEAEEDSDEFDNGDDYGDEHDGELRQQQHESQYYKDDELRRKAPALN